MTVYMLLSVKICDTEVDEQTSLNSTLMKTILLTIIETKESIHTCIEWHTHSASSFFKEILIQSS